MRSAALVTCLLAAGAALSACVEITEVPAPVHLAVQVEVVPASAALTAGASWSFACTVTGAADPGCSWSVTEGSAGGSATAAGVYTAPAAAGTYHVVASSRADPSKAGSATVIVSRSSVSIAVSIAPATVALAAGASWPFTCAVTGSADQGCSWSVQEGSAGGSVTADGVYSAPGAAGTYHVVATSHADPSKFDAATVTVTAAPSPSEPTGPCDLYEAAETPCVAAHSTVRALYGAYDGSLYQVRRASDRTTRDVRVLARGGYADAAAQDTFCAGTTCTISVTARPSPS